MEYVIEHLAELIAACVFAVSAIVSVVSGIRSGNKQSAKELLFTVAKSAVEYAERVANADGATKKSLAMKYIEQKLKESKAKFDEKQASDAIEAIIAFSKAVNGKENHQSDNPPDDER